MHHRHTLLWYLVKSSLRCEKPPWSFRVKYIKAGKLVLYVQWTLYIYMYQCRLPAVNVNLRRLRHCWVEAGMRLDLKDERLQTSIWQQLLSHINPPFLPPLQALLLNPQHQAHRITFSPADWVEQGVEGAQNWTSAQSAFSTRTPPSPLPAHYPRAVTHPPSFPPRSSNISSPLQDRSSFPRNLMIPKRKEL